MREIRTEWVKYRLYFNFEARTSRQVMTYKDTYFIKRYYADEPEVYGIGEVNLFEGLSADDTPDFEERLDRACKGTYEYDYLDARSSAINFGFETAKRNLIKHKDIGHIFYNKWEKGLKPIPINGLVWMGDRATMAQRIKEKLAQGFKCLKLKIGGIDFEQEVSLLDVVRSVYPKDVLEIRLDANGSLPLEKAMERLEILSQYDIHSIEQPIPAGLREEMAYLCANSPIPIALDEELIGTSTLDDKYNLIDGIRPQYLVLKPALCGGFKECLQWMEVAAKNKAGYWFTSALESNVGLAAIADWVSERYIDMPQGLGTGLLYTNNIPSPLEMRGDGLWWNPEKKFDYGIIGFPK